MTDQHTVRLWIRLGSGAVLCAVVGTIALAERAIRMPNRMDPPEEEVIRLVGWARAAKSDVEIRGADGTGLRAWLFTPEAPNGSGVIALHGVGATRVQMLNRAEFLLAAGYTVLTPDSRGHGISGGSVASYGLLESGDVRRWTDLLLSRPGVSRVYGLGLSMGASILIESLPDEPRIRALVADCPFATFAEAASSRVERRLYVPSMLATPIVASGLLYLRFAHGLDLRHASPEDAIGRTTTPVLLIHGDADSRTPVTHSRRLHDRHRASTALWEIPGADHAEAVRADPLTYRRKVIEWFATHP